jgi:uncharacterized membrane protein YkvI
MELDMNEAGETGRGRLIALVIAEAVVLFAGAAAMILSDFGWAGAIGMAVLIAVFTITLFRAGEERARASGSFSPAMGRYNRRMLAAGGIYVVGLFGAIWANDTLQADGALAFLFAFAPSVGVLTMVWAMGRLLSEETDEYLRFRLVRSSLFGLGTLLTLATVWGFFEQFDLVPHAPTWLAVPVFALGLGFANCTRWGRM